MNSQYQGKSYVPWGDIEPKIKSLVETLHMHYLTIWSCEGHLDGGGLPYPWVDLAGNQDIDGLEKRLKKFNSRSEIVWMLNPHWEYVIGNKQKIYRLMPECVSELSKYHEYLINRWKLEQEKGLECVGDQRCWKWLKSSTYA